MTIIRSTTARTSHSQPAFIGQSTTSSTHPPLPQPSADDVVQDILATVARLAPSISPDVLAQVDRAARDMWGGSRPYIGKRSGAGTSARNAAIKRDYWQHGERIALLERRYALSKARLWEIIKS